MSPGRAISNRNFLMGWMRPLHGWGRRCRIFIAIYQQDTSSPVGVTSSPADAAPNGAKNMSVNKNPPGE